MRLGVGLPHQRADGTSFTATEIMQRAQLIEAVGFDGIWVPDSIGRLATPRPDPLMWLLLAGAATTRVELGTAILQVPLRGTVELAQRLLTLHATTSKRFTAGVGACSTQADFDAVGADYTARFRTLSHALPTMRRLFQGEQVDHASLHPWPDTLGGPAIVIGSWASGPWVVRAAREYDGWMASGALTSFRVLSEGIKRYRDAGGRRALVSTIDVDLTARMSRFQTTIESTCVASPPPRPSVSNGLRTSASTMPCYGRRFRGMRSSRGTTTKRIRLRKSFARFARWSTLAQPRVGVERLAHAIADTLNGAGRHHPGWRSGKRHIERFVEQQVVELRVDGLPLAGVRLRGNRSDELLVHRTGVSLVVHRRCERDARREQRAGLQLSATSQRDEQSGVHLVVDLVLPTDSSRFMMLF